MSSQSWSLDSKAPLPIPERQRPTMDVLATYSDRELLDSLLECAVLSRADQMDFDIEGHDEFEQITVPRAHLREAFRRLSAEPTEAEQQAERREELPRRYRATARAALRRLGKASGKPGAIENSKIRCLVCRERRAAADAMARLRVRLSELAVLENGWHDDEGFAPSAEAIARAGELIEKLPGCWKPGLHLFPTLAGGISSEHDSELGQFTLELGPGGSELTLVTITEDGEASHSEPADLEQAVAAIAAAFPEANWLAGESCGCGIALDADEKLRAEARSSLAELDALEAELESLGGIGDPEPDELLFEERLASFAELAADWDSNGGQAPTPEAIAAARKLRRLLAEEPQPVPLGDGGVQLEWQRGGLELELEISPSGELIDPADDPERRLAAAEKALRQIKKLSPVGDERRKLARGALWEMELIR